MDQPEFGSEQRLQQEAEWDRLDAEEDARFAGLEALQEVEVEMRKLDLQQIGYALLSMVGEANHGSWDGIERETLIQYNEFLKEFAAVLRIGDDVTKLPEHDWGFGGPEFWDLSGKRRLRKI